MSGYNAYSMNQIGKIIKYVVIYNRKSREEGDTEETLAQHIERTTKFCEANGWAYDIFNEVETSENEQRPELEKMMEGVRQGKYDAVVVVETSRLARTGSLSNQIADELEFYDVWVFTTRGEKYNLRIPTERAMFDVAATFYSLELRTTKLRLKDGALQKVAQGEWMTGKTPTGYSAVNVKVEGAKGGKRRILKPNDDAPMVKRMFDLAEQGYGMAEIAKMVGVSFSGAKNILHNVVYTGKLVFDIYDGNKNKKKRKIIDTIEVDNAYEPIVSTEQFIKVQKAIESRMTYDKKEVSRNKGEVRWILKDLVFCECGRKLGFQFNKDWKPRLKSCIHGCNMVGSPVYKVLEVFQTEFDSLEQFWKEEWEKVLETPITDLKSHIVSKLKERKNHLAKLEKRLENARTYLLDETLTNIEYTSLKEKINSEKNSTVEEINKLEKELETTNVKKISRGYEEKLELIKKANESDDITEVNRILKLLIDKIEYKRGDEINGNGEIEQDVITLKIYPK